MSTGDAYARSSTDERGAKRRRRSPSPAPPHRQREHTHEETQAQQSFGGGAAAVITTAASVAYSGMSGEEEMASSADLSDTVSALTLLVARLHANGRFAACPLILRHQVYTILDDATAVDLELEQLRRQNYLRMIKMQTQADEVGLLRTATYQARIADAIDKAASPERKAALVLLQTVVGHVTNISVSFEEVASHHQHPTGKDNCCSSSSSKRSRGCSLSSSSSSIAPGGAAVPVMDVDGLLQQLVKAGFLVPRREGGQQVYWFSAPEAGRIAASIPPGRQAILAAIRRSRYKELVDKNLDKIKMPKSELSAAFHIADLVGSGELLPVATAAGTFYRIKI